jgi:hypothetical protein
MNASDVVVAVIESAVFAEHDVSSRQRVEQLLKGFGHWAS